MATNKMQNLINYRMRVTLSDGRQMTGSMLAFDKHMNLVLADTQEFRRIRKSKPAANPTNAPLVEAVEKRTLGLIIIRGAQVVSCSVDGPPPADPSARLGGAGPGPSATLAAGPGISKPAGRGLPVGLGGPAAGVGAPAPAAHGGFPGAFPGAPHPGFVGRGGPPSGPSGFPQPGFVPPPGFPQGAPGFQQQPPGFQPPSGPGRGYPPPGYGGR